MPRLLCSIFLSVFALMIPALTLAAESPPKAISSTIEGVLVQVSKLPPAENNSYADCYYTAIIDIDHIDTGESLAKQVVLVLPGFFSRKYTPEANFKAGDKVRATVVPFASMPENIRQTQQADEIEAVDLEFYFPQQIALIHEFQKVTDPIPFADRAKQVEEMITSQTTDLKARAARQESMRHDLEQINQLLAAHDGDWDKWYDSLKGFRAQYQKQFDAKAQRWVGDSFFSAGYVDNGKIYSPEFIKSIVALKEYLATRNVDLILVRVPLKGEVVDDLFAPAPADQVTNPYLLRMYKELLEADVEIVTDIIPRAKEERLKYPLMYWYQDSTESHPAEGISWVIAEELAKRATRYKLVTSANKKIFNIHESSNGGRITEGWQNLKWPAGNRKFSPDDYVRYATVVDDNKNPVELKKGVDSPVLVLGSSFIAAPSLPNGGTIPHYFTYLTGIVPDLLYRRDADFMMPRMIAREGTDLLRNRAVCLFPFVPWVSQKALAPLPLFDPEKSSKTLLAHYSGPVLRETIEILSVTPGGVFAYSPEDVLRIQKSSKDSEPTVRLRIKVPKEIASYPSFIVTVQFESNDVSSISASYAGQHDFVKRGIAEPNEEAFPFTTKSDSFVTIDFTLEKLHTVPTDVKGLKFFGVQQPAQYKLPVTVGS